MRRNKKKIALGIVLCLGLLFSFWGISGNLAAGITNYTTLDNVVNKTPITDSVIGPIKLSVRPLDSYIGSQGMYIDKIDANDASVESYNVYMQSPVNVRIDNTDSEISISRNGIIIDSNLMPASELADVVYIIKTKTKTYHLNMIYWGEFPYQRLSSSIATDLKEGIHPESVYGTFYSKVISRKIHFTSVNYLSNQNCYVRYGFNVHNPESISYDEVMNLTCVTDDGVVELPENDTAGKISIFVVDVEHHRISLEQSLDIPIIDYHNPVSSIQYLGEPVEDMSTVYYSEKTIDDMIDQSGSTTPDGTISLVQITNSDNQKLQKEDVICNSNLSKSTNNSGDIFINILPQSDGTKDGRYDFQVDLSDNADNTSYYSRYIVYDTQDPVIDNITIQGASYNADNAFLFNQPVEFSFRVLDLTGVTVSVSTEVGNLNDSDIVLKSNSSGVYTYIINKDFKDKIVIRAVDKVGHVTTFKTNDIELDTTPLSTSSVMINNAYDILNTEDNAVATATNTFSLTPDATDVKSISIAVGDKTSNFFENENNEGGYTASLELSEGIYSAEITMTDLAGNVSKAKTKDFLIDTTAPQISSVTIQDEAYGEDSTRFFNEPIKISFVVQDFTETTLSLYTGNTRLTDSDMTFDGEKDGLYTYTINKEFNDILKIIAEDKVGHKTTFRTDILKLDTTPINASSVMLNNTYDILNIENTIVNTKSCNFSVIPNGDDVKSIVLTIGEESVGFTKDYGFYFADIELAEGVYTAELVLTDVAENITRLALKDFAVDYTSPVIDYSREGNKLSFKVTDKNIEEMLDATIVCSDTEKDITELEVSIGGKKYSGSIPYVRSLIMDKANWKPAGDDSYTFEVSFLAEGNYEFAFTSTDIAGNTSDEIMDKLVEDNTAPDFVKASFSVEKKGFSDYKYISKDTIGLEITGNDIVSGIESVTVHYTDITGKKINGTCEKKEGEDNTYLYFFGKASCEKGLIDSISITDKSGNSCTTDFKNGIIIDKETDDVELLHLIIEDDAKGKDVLNNDLNLTFTLRDTYSGLSSYEYTLNGVKVEGSGGIKDITYEKTITDTIVAAKNEGDDILVELTATDNAGNSKTVSKKYSFDTTKPSINISYDSTTDNNYYKVTRTATVTIKDEHFYDKGVDVTITNNESKIDTKLNFTSSDDKTYAATIPLADEGVYSVGLTVTDKAGNFCAFKDGKSFTIDKTAPKLSISYDDTKASNGKYFNGTRVANVLVDELNFDENLVSMDITTEGGKVPQISSFSNRNTNHMAVLSFAVDGTYTISGKVTDLAGNESEVITDSEFVIDTKEPEITFSDIKKGSSYNGDVTPSVSVSDINYDATELSLSGSKYGEHEEHKVSSDKSEGGETFKYSSFEKVLGSDDAYTLTATAKDLAGNVKEETITFRVNRFGSRYSLDAYTTEAMEKYYVTSDKDFVIIEDNLDRVNNYKLCYISDGATRVLDFDKDYTVDSSTNNSSWNTYSYRIKTDMLNTDGVYSFVVYSEDAAGNTSDNVTKGTPLKVCIDNTAPIITVSGVEDTGVYRVPSVKANIVITDNIAFDKATVLLNGEPTEYTESTISLDLKESKKEQTLEVVATDKAGNSISSDTYTFLVDEKAGEGVKVESKRESKKISLMPFIIGFVVVFILAAGISIVVVLKDRKKKENEGVE